MNVESDPLESLVPIPLHCMSDDQLKEQVRHKRELQMAVHAKNMYFENKKAGIVQPAQATVLDEVGGEVNPVKASSS